MTAPGVTARTAPRPVRGGTSGAHGLAAVPLPPPPAMSEPSQSDADVPLSGTIPIAAGQPSVVRIPVPGTDRLAVELTPRGRIPKGGSTSTLFIQDRAGRRQLRLDYGPNPRVGNAIDYHWNQDRVYAQFGISDHTSVGRAGAAAYHAARAYRWGGRVLVVVGAVADGISVVQASRPLRRAAEVASAWALAWAGCRTVGQLGALGGTAIEPGLGTAGGAILGCIVGGYAGYRGGEAIGGTVYEWAEGTLFARVPETPLP